MSTSADRASQRVDEELKERIARAQGVVDEKRAELEATIADKKAEVEEGFASEKARIEEQQAARAEELATAAKELEAAIKAGGKEIAEDVVFAATGEVIARAGSTSKDALAKLREVAKAEVNAVDKDAKAALASAAGEARDRDRGPDGGHRRGARQRAGAGRTRDR